MLGQCPTGLQPSQDATTYTYNQYPTGAGLPYTDTFENISGATRSISYGEWDSGGNLLGTGALLDMVTEPDHQSTMRTA